MQKLPGIRSNWEFLTWHLINRCMVLKKDRRFSRSQLLQGQNDDLYNLLRILGHKDKPERVENTLQKTLQNMRDKNWIRFHGDGQYEVTAEGCEVLLAQIPKMDALLSPEGLTILRKIAKGG